eukprot:4685916-Pyramimonas_sp.AAC.1
MRRLSMRRKRGHLDIFGSKRGKDTLLSVCVGAKLFVAGRRRRGKKDHQKVWRIKHAPGGVVDSTLARQLARLAALSWA